MGKQGKIGSTPWCPFCGQEVESPKEPVQRKMDEFHRGSCQCGAHFVSDQTGHNIGSAMVECLVNACNENWELAWDLDPDEDYLTGLVEDYDEVTHQIIESRNLDGRAIRGILYFVRLNQDVSELAVKVSQSDIAEPAIQGKPVIPVEPLRDPKRQKKRAKKLEVKNLADDQNIDALVDLSFDDKKTLAFLQRLLYDPFEEKRWMYAHVLGQVCGRHATRKPGAISDLLHRMYEACSDSAAAHWGLLEAIGSIIAARPDIFGGFAKHLLMFRNLPTTRVQVLWALSEIAKSRPDHVRAAPFYSLFNMLEHPDPLTRGQAARLFGLINATEVKGKIEELLTDNTAITLYIDGKALNTTVASLAQKAMTRLCAKEMSKDD